MNDYITILGTGNAHATRYFPEVESVKNDEKRHGYIVSGLL